MKNLIMKWWIIRSYRRMVMKHNDKLENRSVSSELYLRKSEFVAELSKKSSQRFSTILWWRKNSKKRINRRIQQYNTIINICTTGKDKYFKNSPANRLGLYLKPTALAYDFDGYFPLIQKLLSDYKLIWTLLVPTLLGTIYKSSIILQWLKKWYEH